MLIAMLLTALIGLVLFSTYRNVSESRRAAARFVDSQEHPRVFRAILDDDFSSLFIQFDRRLPLLSRKRILVGAAYLEAAGEEADEEEGGDSGDEELLFSFAGTVGLAPDAPAPPLALFCVEYVLRRQGDSQALVRRERPHCGVEGRFPWDEYVLLPTAHRVLTDVWPRNGERFVEEWQGMRSSDDLPEAVRFRIWHAPEDAYPETLLIRTPGKYSTGRAGKSLAGGGHEQ